MKRRFRRSLRAGETLVVGPWAGDVATELLYWIPFVRWGLHRYAVDPKTVVAASAHDVGAWYSDLASSFVQVESRDQLTGSLARARLLGPALLGRFCEPFWEGRGPIREILKHAHYLGPRRDLGEGIVLDLAPTPAFSPGIVAAQGALESSLEELSGSCRRLTGSESERTDVIASAERLVAGFGRSTHAGILIGVPTVALYTEADIHKPTLALAQRVARRLGVPFTALSLQELGALRNVLSAAPARDNVRDR